MSRRHPEQIQMFDYGDIEPVYPDRRDLHPWPWGETVDRLEELGDTTIRAELEAAGVPIIYFEGSSLQAAMLRMQSEADRT